MLIIINAFNEQIIKILLPTEKLYNSIFISNRFNKYCRKRMVF